MQPSPTPSPQNPLAEIAALVIAALLIIGGVILLAIGKIDFAYATSLFLLAVGIVAANVALKAPSPAQQQQIQTIVNQLMDVLPGVVAHINQPAPPVVIHIPPSPPVQVTPQPAPQGVFPERFAGDSPAATGP